MTDTTGKAFWQEMAGLATDKSIVLDRARGTAHPRYPELIYPFDYGYVEGTYAADGDGIDVWIGSLGKQTLTGILCTFDTTGRDAEIKLMLGCTEADIRTIINFYSDAMPSLFIPKPEENK